MITRPSKEAIEKAKVIWHWVACEEKPNLKELCILATHCDEVIEMFGDLDLHNKEGKEVAYAFWWLYIWEKNSEKEMKKYMKNELGTLAQVRI